MRRSSWVPSMAVNMVHQTMTTFVSFTRLTCALPELTVSVSKPRIMVPETSSPRAWMSSIDSAIGWRMFCFFWVWRRVSGSELSSPTPMAVKPASR